MRETAWGGNVKFSCAVGVQWDRERASGGGVEVGERDRGVELNTKVEVTARLGGRWPGGVGGGGGDRGGESNTKVEVAVRGEDDDLVVVVEEE